MSEHDDYLFRRTGAPDAEIEALERLLAPLAHDGRALPPQLGSPVRVAPRRRLLPWLLVAVLLLAAGAVLATWRSGGVELAPGSAAATFVAEGSPRRLQFAAAGEVDLAAGSEMRFEHWRDDSVLVHLVRGSVAVRVTDTEGKRAPVLRVGVGGLELVADAVAPKCSFQLALDGSEAGAVHVKDGALRVVAATRSVLVPRGASTRFFAADPGQPLFDDCPADLRAAAQLAAAYASKGGPEFEAKALDGVLAACRSPRDSLVLWNVLASGNPDTRAAAEGRLLELAGAPEPIGKVKQASWPNEVWLRHLWATAWAGR